MENNNGRGKLFSHSVCKGMGSHTGMILSCIYAMATTATPTKEVTLLQQLICGLHD